MKNPRQIALNSFEENKNQAEKSKTVADRRQEQLKRQIADFPKPDWWQIFLKSNLSKLRRELSQVSAEVGEHAQHIRRYQEVIDGIKREDYEPAILLIEEIIPQIQQRAQHEPIGMLFGASGLASDLERLKVDLIVLSRTTSP